MTEPSNLSTPSRTKRKRDETIKTSAPDAKKVDSKAEEVSISNDSLEAEEDEEAEKAADFKNSDDEVNEDLYECRNCGNEFDPSEGSECLYHDCECPM